MMNTSEEARFSRCGTFGGLQGTEVYSLVFKWLLILLKELGLLF